MSDLTIHNKISAPEGARQTLVEAERAFGFVPNLLGIMAEAPPLLKAYFTLFGLFEQTTLSPTERQIVLLATSYENGCDYCMAAHSTVATMRRVPEDVVEALRQGRPLQDKKLDALRRFVVATVRERGWPSDREVEGLLAAGYTKTHILEVILGVGLKILSNYTNHVADTPLDAAFARWEWKKASRERRARTPQGLASDGPIVDRATVS